jgi:hypothetical protein
MMSSVNELVDHVLWRELVQHLERRKSTVSYRRPNVDLKLHYVVTDYVNDGKIIKRSGIRNAHSLVANFLATLGWDWTNNGGIFNNNGTAWARLNATYGIVVGTGTQTKSVKLIDLDTPINPSNTGLVYGNESYTGPVPTNNDTSAVLREIRSFTNNGSSSYTLTEIGIYGNLWNTVGTLNGFELATWSGIFDNSHFLMAYDLLSPSVVIQPSQTVTFEYDWIVNV